MSQGFVNQLPIPLPINKGGTGSVTGVVPSSVAANSGAGIPVQVIVAQVTAATATTSSSTMSNITGLSIVITPSAVTSKILLRASLQIGNTNGDLTNVQFANNGSAIGRGDAAGSRTRCTGSAIITALTELTPITIEWEDSPNTTSAVTYTVQWANTNNASSVYLNRTVTDTDSAVYPRAVSCFTAMEIK